jgi:uncharacterized flavoprotein (TIGR03862 family)
VERKNVVIVGGGACALMLGSELDRDKFNISIYERNSALGRKFLVAGDGGLNITHSEPPANFIRRYTPPGFLDNAFKYFDNTHLIKWLNEKGIPTFTGSSGRVFPLKDLKPIDVLKILEKLLLDNNVHIHYKHVLKNFDINQLQFDHQGKPVFVPKADIVIFCLGGASWPVTGSGGEWAEIFADNGIKVNPFVSSNCRFMVKWPKDLKTEGKVLKNISISCNNVQNYGEVTICADGIEGSGIYPLSPQIRDALSGGEKAIVYIDLKPSFTADEISLRFRSKSKEKNYSEHVRASINLSKEQFQLLKKFSGKEEFTDPDILANKVKSLPIEITGLGPIEDAISTAGGISREEVDESFQLKKIRGTYVIGEMLDYDAPTGGYLLQSCFSMGKYLAHRLNEEN